MAPKKGDKNASKYNPIYCDQIGDYFGAGYNSPNEKAGENFPTYEGFAIQIGVDRDTIRNWATAYADFGTAYRKCKDYQADRLVKMALADKVNTTFAIFFAKNNLGYSDKIDRTETVIHKFTDQDKKILENLGIDCN